MEKQFAVGIGVWFDRHSDECHRQIDGKSIVETFLHDVAAEGKRFPLVLAGGLRAVVSGICTKAEIELLHEELDDFFTVYGLNCGTNGWNITAGEEISPQRMVFEDGKQKAPQMSITLTLDEDWVSAQEYAPAPIFLEQLQKKLRCRLLDSTQQEPFVPGHFRLRFGTDCSVGRIWEAGQSTLREMGVLPYVMEFEVRGIQENGEEEQ